MAFMDPPKCTYCGEYHFNFCSKELMEKFDSKYQCVICGLPIYQHDPMIGMGIGTDEYLKQQFAHEACYWRHRTDEAEAEVKRLQTYVGELEYRCYRAEESNSCRCASDDHD